MKFIPLVLLTFLSALQLTAQDKFATDDRIEQLIDQMSVEEKAGQMTQVTIDMILKDDSSTEIDPKKLRFAIKDMQVGSILNVKWHAYDLATWDKVITAIQDVATKETRLGVPILYGIDAIHGANYTQGSTLFPHNIGMAATRDRNMVRAGAQMTAKEVRASGHRWNFDPTLGVGRQPLWARFEETFGEDTYLAAELGAEVIQGYEAKGLDHPEAVASCMKHFIGYSNPRSGKDRTPAYMTDRELREHYLPTFEAAVAAGTSTVMINSGELDGMPVHASKYLLTDVLRNELGFKGMVVSDWEDVIRLKLRAHIAETDKEAVRLAVEAGLDMSMVPLDYSFRNLLIELVKEGRISEERLDESVRRILVLKRNLGLFDQPYIEAAARANFGLEEYAEIALESAQHSMTLLKNEKEILPLKAGQKILLAGPAANEFTCLHSSWSYNWQGNGKEYYPKSTKTIYQAMQERFGADQVSCVSVDDFESPLNTDAKQLSQMAKDADVLVLCLGEKAYAESPGGIHDLTLDQAQLDLAQAAIATGKPVIYVMVQGRPRVISGIEAGADAILQAYRPSSQGAKAIVSVLSGDFNPSGKLPFTYQRNTGDIVLYDHKFAETFTELAPGEIGMQGFNPQWEFGHGLSYTTFEYGTMQVDKTSFTGDEQVKVTITVTNTGDQGGHHAVDLFSRDNYASVSPCVKRLRAFDKKYIEAGATETFEFTIDADDLSFINFDSKRITEKGTFTLFINDQAISIEYQ